MIWLQQGDCLELMKNIPDGYVDLVLTDPPYGTMKGASLDGWKNQTTEWDIAIEPVKIFEQISRILRPNGKAVLFSQEPYTSRLITSAIPSLPFCYRAIWYKNVHANALLAKSAMVSRYEDICVFANKDSGGLLNKCVEKISDVVFSVGFQKFAEIMFGEGRYKDIASARKNLYKKVYIEGCNEYDKNFFDEPMYRYLETQIEMPYTFEEYFAIVAEYKEKTKSVFNLWQGGKSKSNVLEYAKDNDGYHPTQKPVALLEDLIQTYSNEGDIVLDFTMGSGSTGVACVNLNRKFIGMELKQEYFNIATERINDARHNQQTGGD